MADQIHGEVEFMPAEQPEQVAVADMLLLQDRVGRLMDRVAAETVVV